MNVILRGRSKEIVETMVKEGIANTQSEAIRFSILIAGEKMLSEEELVSRKISQMDEEIAQGKRKLLNSQQALGKYAKYLKR